LDTMMPMIKKTAKNTMMMIQSRVAKFIFSVLLSCFFYLGRK
jgi:hypothetical protein